MSRADPGIDEPDSGQSVGTPPSRNGRVSVPELRSKKRGGPSDPHVCMVTAYDATFAHMADVAGVDAILVGDSLGMVIQGHDTTLPVTLDEMIYHCRSVARGSRRAHLTCDLPFLSYQASPDDAIRSAGRVLKEGAAQSVKVEGGRVMEETIARMVAVGIPVIGHVGLTPQSVHAMGGFRTQGRTQKDEERVLDDASAVAEAGAYALVLEGMPSNLARRITETVPIPTIGIGAGPHCDGQVLVGYDLLGLTPNFRPRFVKHFDDMWRRGLAATERFCAEVREGSFPSDEYTSDTTPTPDRPAASDRE